MCTVCGKLIYVQDIPKLNIVALYVYSYLILFINFTYFYVLFTHVVKQTGKHLIKSTFSFIQYILTFCKGYLKTAGIFLIIFRQTTFSPITKVTYEESLKIVDCILSYSWCTSVIYHYCIVRMSYSKLNFK